MSPRHTRSAATMARCDHTQLWRLGYTLTRTPWPRSTISPPATQSIRSGGTPAASMTRIVS